MNVIETISRTFRRFPAKPAIVLENCSYTYADMDQRVRSCASMLAGMGVERGDPVAIQLPKSVEFVFLHLAVLSLGAVALPLNPDYKPEEVEYFLSDSGSSFFFTDGDRFRKTRQVLDSMPRLRVVLTGEDEISGARSLHRELNKARADFIPGYATKGSDTAVICYTSGTTGRPKGAMITHRNLTANMVALKEAWQITDRDILLHALPLFHVHGLFVALHSALYAGCTTIMHRTFNPAYIWETIESAKCTLFMGVPTMYQRLMNHWDSMKTKPNLSTMRVFISGSAPLLEHQFRRFEQTTGFRILERYGMTETGMITSNPLDAAGRIATSVGYALPGVEIRVVRSDGQDTGPAEVGEVYVRGDNVFKGYWEMPEKTSETFDGAWLKSGDLGYLDPGDPGRLFLVGRAKELIITGGYNVYPKEIENLLDTHTSVKESAVIGLPDEDFGERVTAVVALKEGAEKTTSESLIQYCKEHLVAYKCPKQIFLTDRLPRNAMGKLQKTALVERLGKER